jgi:LysM repeat protein
MHLCSINLKLMKKLFTLLFLLPAILFAQKTTNHTVAAKESFSSIGRMYNINPRELATLNKLDYEKGLSIGQVLKVPVVAKPKVEKVVPAVVTKEKVVASQKVDMSKELEPTMHTIAAKETLYGLSKLYNTTVADIKKWNNITADGLKDGDQIIVGYTNAKNIKVTPTNEENAEKTVVSVNTNTNASEPKEDIANEVKTVAVTKEVPAVKKEISSAKKVVEVPNVSIEPSSSKDFGGGFFKNSFTSNGEEEAGVAGVFKSTSGWEDGKYYCLHNGASSGTILKITNKANGKTVYAKVLDTMPDLKPNANLIVRLSNAAADFLGAGSSNFNCSVSY